MPGKEKSVRLDSLPPAVYVAPTAMLLRPTFTFIPPALPSPGDCPPIGGEWIHEIKHDGFRMMVRRDASGVRLLTRNGKDVGGPLAVLDRRIVVLGPK